MCFRVYGQREVSEEHLSGARNDVCSRAAELGHREVQRRRGKKDTKLKKGKLTDSESAGWRSSQEFTLV